MRVLAYRIVDRYLDFRSFKTNRKLLVIESDDWGSRRTDDRRTLERLKKLHCDALDAYTIFDNIADVPDLSGLFDVLSSVRDVHGRPACLTANVSTANPAFDLILNSKFEEFYYEPFYETIRNRSRGQEILNMWSQGRSERLFIPQLHGREHVHALAWLAELRAGNKTLLDAFSLNAYGVPYRAVTKQRRSNLQAALDYYGLNEERSFQVAWIRQAVDIFRSYFGYCSTTFIAPAYIWHSSLAPVFAACGIRGLQGIKIQFEPRYGFQGAYSKSLRFTGQSSRYHITNLVRNAFFEPSLHVGRDCVGDACRRIEAAFVGNRPAILSSHRLNYIGSLSSRNRDKNLALLRSLLQRVKQKWPDVEFISSAELLDIVETQR